jgi:ferredoxin-thioredoxin reductase catalytic subunit
MNSFLFNYMVLLKRIEEARKSGDWDPVIEFAEYAQSDLKEYIECYCAVYADKLLPKGGNSCEKSD